MLFLHFELLLLTSQLIRLIPAQVLLNPLLDDLPNFLLALGRILDRLLSHHLHVVLEGYSRQWCRHKT